MMEPIEIFADRDGAISFPQSPEGLPEGVSWATHGYLYVTCEFEQDPDMHQPAPMPINALPRIIEAVGDAFTRVEATGEHGSRIRAYFKRIDPSASEVIPRGPVDAIIFRDGERTCALWGHFGTVLGPEGNSVSQLSTDCVGTFDTGTQEWMDDWDDSIHPPQPTYIGVWASPCLGVPI